MYFSFFEIFFLFSSSTKAGGALKPDAKSNNVLNAIGTKGKRKLFVLTSYDKLTQRNNLRRLFLQNLIVVNRKQDLVLFLNSTSHFQKCFTGLPCECYNENICDRESEIILQEKKKIILQKKKIFLQIKTKRNFHIRSKTMEDDQITFSLHFPETKGPNLFLSFFSIHRKHFNDKHRRIFKIKQEQLSHFTSCRIFANNHSRTRNRDKNLK